MFRDCKKDNLQFVLIVGLVSIACIGVFLLPPEIRDMLKVRHAVFNPIAYITASFVHDDPMHLVPNLSAFALVGSLLYAINKRINEQKFFFFSLLIMFVVLPLLNYVILFCLDVYRSIEFGFGLSLVDSGLIGSTIPFLMFYFERKLEKFNPIRFFASMILFTLSLISVRYVGSFGVLCSVLLAILGFICGISEIKRILSFLASSLKSRKTLCDSLLVLFALCFYFFFIFCLFPSTIVSQKGIVDIFSHYSGFVLGIALTSLERCIYLKN